MELVKGGDKKQEVAMIANLAELSPEDVGKIDLKDYKKILDVFVSFQE